MDFSVERLKIFNTNQTLFCLVLENWNYQFTLSARPRARMDFLFNSHPFLKITRVCTNKHEKIAVLPVIRSEDNKDRKVTQCPMLNQVTKSHNAEK